MKEKNQARMRNRHQMLTGSNTQTTWLSDCILIFAPTPTKNKKRANFRYKSHNVKKNIYFHIFFMIRNFWLYEDDDIRFRWRVVIVPAPRYTRSTLRLLFVGNVHWTQRIAGRKGAVHKSKFPMTAQRPQNTSKQIHKHAYIIVRILFLVHRHRWCY